MKKKERKSAINGFRLCIDKLLTWVSGLPRSTATSIHPFVQYAKVTLLEISPCQGPIVKRSGVAYSCSYALLVSLMGHIHLRGKWRPRRMSVNTKMEHRTFAWVLVITPTRVHLSESVSRKDSERKMFQVQAAFLPSVEVENNFWNFRWRPSLYPFPNPIFTVTLLKILYLNCNHRR